jgi:pectin methylesterase-like acyl-CoA thioesterase
VVITVKKDGSDVTGNGSSENPYQTIQYAINAVSSTTKEDTVEVYEGTYEENIDFGGKIL